MIRDIAVIAAVPVLWAAVSFAQAVTPDEVPLDAKIVVMGEFHDIAQHHANQAAWVARMAPAAVVFEMLEPGQGAVATRLADAPTDELETALAWEARGWPDFDDYAPIFEAANGARIYGGGVPRDAVFRAAESGAAAAFAGDAARFGLDLDLPLEERGLRESLQNDAHCGELPADTLPGMVEAQRLRDAELARIALRALDETGGPVAIITGNGHARADWGVPLYLGFAAPDVSVFAIGQFTDGMPDAPYDAVVFSDVDPPGRPDPCAALR